MSTWFRPPQALILAGGKGTRLAPITAVIPKPLLPLGDRPILDVLLRQLQLYDFDRIILAVNYLQELFEGVIGDGRRYGVTISYVRETTPLGTAGALALVGPFGDDLLVMNGDILTTLDYRRFVRFHHDCGAAFTLAVNRRRVDVDYGVIETDGDGRVVEYREKPKLDYLVSMGVYAVHARAVEHVRPGERVDIPDLVKRLVAAGEPVQVFPYDGYWMDIGRPEDYELATREFSQMEPQLLPSPGELRSR
jgi:NDP-sugar pyrophosphorylase family protein